MVTKKVFRKKVRRKVRRKYGRKMALSAPFPYSKLVKLRYSDYITLNSGIGQTAYWTFRANDLYDPDVTGVGHQPRGFDQWMNMYNKFVVIGSKITVRFSSDQTPAQIVGVVCNTTTMGSTDITDYMEDRAVRSTILENDAPRTLSQVFGHKKWFKNKPMSDDVVQGSASSSPSNQVYYGVFSASAANGSDAGTVNAYVVIDYIAVVFDPKLPTIS